jgi:hypothetical protein
MTTIPLLTPACEPAAPVTWEPCAEGRPDEPGAVLCVVCGWPLDDHTPGGPVAAARAA